MERLVEWQVDIFACQELAPGQAEAIQGVLPHGKLEPAVDFTGMGIASRRPLEVSRVALPCRDGRVTFVPAEETPHGVGFWLLNLHIAAPHTGIPWRTAALRRRQVRGAMEWLRLHSGPVLLVGDLNSTPVWPAYHVFRRELRDAARDVAGIPRRTWAPTPEFPRLLRIDHALYRGLPSPGLRVVPIRGGDHSGVLVEWPEKASGES